MRGESPCRFEVVQVDVGDLRLAQRLGARGEQAAQPGGLLELLQREAEQRAFVERRGHDVHVGQVAAAEVGVVVDEDVPGLEGLPGLERLGQAARDREPETDDRTGGLDGTLEVQDEGSQLLGFLLQWPTLLTLVMFPILVAMYGRLAVTEEREMRERFGAEFDAYAARTPRFVPALGGRASLAECVVRGPAGVAVLAGSSGTPGMARLSDAERKLLSRGTT